MKQIYFIPLVIIILIFAGCAQQPAEELPVSPPAPIPEETPAPFTTPETTIIPSPTPAPTTTPSPTPASPPDTTPPSAITGLVANNAYEGRVNLWWGKSATEVTTPELSKFEAQLLEKLVEVLVGQ